MEGNLNKMIGSDWAKDEVVEVDNPRTRTSDLDGMTADLEKLERKGSCQWKKYSIMAIVRMYFSYPLILSYFSSFVTSSAFCPILYPPQSTEQQTKYYLKIWTWYVFSCKFRTIPLKKATAHNFLSLVSTSKPSILETIGRKILLDRRSRIQNKKPQLTQPYPCPLGFTWRHVSPTYIIPGIPLFTPGSPRPGTKYGAFLSVPDLNSGKNLTRPPFP